MFSPFDLTSRVAIITGGNGGLGLGMARGLAAAGADIALVGRNREKLATAAQAIADDFGKSSLQIQADLTQETDVTRAVGDIYEHFKRVDILINNAGMNIRKNPHECSLDEFRQVIDGNLTSAFLVAKAVYPLMKSQQAGKVINVGSMASVFGAPFAAAYASAKGGVVQLTKSQALAWAADNIQVNAILPGWFDTDLTRRARVEVPATYDRVITRIPLGRWGDPADIAGTAVWLASSASDYVTGVAIPVDGGYTSQI